MAVQIDFDVVDRLLREVQRGFGLVPRRGVEMGGLLIGSYEPVAARPGTWLVRVVDFEGIPCSHSKGMAYQLSEEEEVRFQEVLGRWKRADGRPAYAVGMYRSHTREGLGMAPEDVDLFQRWFPDPAAVALLVKPFATRASVGAIFFRENGQLRSESSHLEFPFRRSDLGGGDAEAPPELGDAPQTLDITMESTVRRNGDGLTPAPAELAPVGGGFLGLADEAPPPERPKRGGKGAKAAAAAGPSSASADVPSAPPVSPFGIPGARRDPVTGKRIKTGWVWIPLSFIFLLLGVIVGFQGALGLRGGARGTGSGDPFALGLTATSAGSTIEVRWDGASLAIQGAARGALTINDGGLEKVVNLDPNLLRNASISYPRSNHDVRFILEVFARERTSVTESVSVRPGTSSQPVDAPSPER